MSATKKHTHEIARTSDARSFTMPVAVHPYTDQNRAAHGGVEYTDHCECGATRKRLVNGRHEEIAPWNVRGIE